MTIDEIKQAVREIAMKAAHTCPELIPDLGVLLGMLDQLQRDEGRKR